jgi:inorganic pyrophosphatase
MKQRFFHPWHDLANDRIEDGIIRCVIEIPKGSKVKYEMDKESGLLKLDRVLFSSVMYPANYGFIPRTLDYDDDPLDMLVLCSEVLEPMCLVEARVIGVMRMEDGGKHDDKILCVASNDISINYIKDIGDLPPHTTVEMKRFFQDYKVLENKAVLIEDFVGREKAIEIVKHCTDLYTQKILPDLS